MDYGEQRNIRARSLSEQLVRAEALLRARAYGVPAVVRDDANGVELAFDLYLNRWTLLAGLHDDLVPVKNAPLSVRMQAVSLVPLLVAALEDALVEFSEAVVARRDELAAYLDTLEPKEKAQDKEGSDQAASGFSGRYRSDDP